MKSAVDKAYSVRVKKNLTQAQQFCKKLSWYQFLKFI
jgi:hypothetical protein